MSMTLPPPIPGFPELMGGLDMQALELWLVKLCSNGSPCHLWMEMLIYTRYRFSLSRPYGSAVSLILQKR